MQKEIFEKLEKEFGNSLQKQFRLTLSSVSSSDSSESEILFLEPFLAHSMDLGNGVSVSVKSWAAAFMQWEYQEIFDVLKADISFSKGLIETDKQEPLYNEKIKNAIHEAATWMKEKTKDPWSYTPKEKLKDDSNTNISSVDSKTDVSQDQIENPYLNAFKVVQSPHFPELGNCAQKVKWLTFFTMPKTTDIFVDAVQFSRPRWNKASRMEELTQIADILFRKYFRYDYVDKYKTFVSFEDFCPVKRLAIIRAVAFLKYKDCWPDLFEFDSSNASHNLFLKRNEIQEITKYINERYNNKNTTHNTPIPKDVAIN